ncbi:hypothetical protein NDI56_05855 [Haloarcula sp. S1CR25-12]|uniref:Uncharacterized protein n=1 Tax=Haloarcula saliterrae TaxID=2950534 RepID=A0ABU2F9F7_9EURY|nr:hypothetical protein [Haloarcula sp. S1CR25-12]MDS0258915.1 hypothetical protein [Haloarcula sp. S1CR25-12]
MGTVSETERDLLEPHVPSGEQLLEAYSGDVRTVAVTDRRVLDLRHRSGNRREDTKLESVLLNTDYVVGADYNRNQSADYPVLEWILGAGLVLGGVIGMVLGMGDAYSQSPLLQVVIASAGALLILLGVAVFAIAGFGGTSGGVAVTVYRAGGLDDRTWQFPKGETAVARAISEQVAALNAPL